MFQSVLPLYNTTMTYLNSLSIFFLCSVLYHVTNASLIKGPINDEPVFKTKDVSARENMIIDDAKIEKELPIPEVPPKRRCAEIGEFCVNHNDCCTNACLGYMKKCVSGSG
ncbi:unnamed protein product [Leptidea sinapis]|uniref:Uncharacterized protein n=1 Tax=Leptidea sinapis TaxID=189913 RepID=A0A5E4PZH6_9NEOP|nr:unnamed protein product [Leptidea sinapis]